MVIRTGSAKVGELTNTVTDIFDSAFRALAVLNGQVEDVYRRRGALPPSAALGELRPAVIATLGGTHDLLAGAGLIAGPGALADADLGAEWWKSQRDGRPTRLVLELDPESPSYFDFTRLPWFVVPRQTGEEHITGPYVDYVCTDEYSLTLSAPARFDGRFLGVVGADIYVRSLEIALLPALRDLGADALLVNAQGRVIVSNSLRYGTGSMIREPRLAVALADGSPEASGFTLHRCGRHPITLITDQG